MNMPEGKSPSDNGWDEWGKHVLWELKRLSDCYCGLQDTVNGMKNELSVLKVQAGIWGALAGAIPAALAVLYILLKEGR